MKYYSPRRNGISCGKKRVFSTDIIYPMEFGYPIGEDMVEVTEEATKYIKDLIAKNSKQGFGIRI